MARYHKSHEESAAETSCAALRVSVSVQKTVRGDSVGKDTRKTWPFYLSDCLMVSWPFELNIFPFIYLLIVVIAQNSTVFCFFSTNAV